MYIDTKKMRYYTLTTEQPIAQEQNGLNEKEIQGGFFYEEKSIKCITYSKHGNFFNRMRKQQKQQQTTAATILRQQQRQQQAIPRHLMTRSQT